MPRLAYLDRGTGHPHDRMYCHAYTDTTAVAVTDPAEAITAIADAALSALAGV